MRFPEALRRLAALAACAAASAVASPEAVKGDVEARLHAQLPALATRDYVLGSAAFDDALRAGEEAHAEAAKAIVERGAALWKRRFKDGRSLASCFPNGGRRVAAAYPQYHPRLKLVFTLEMAINQCLKSHHEPLIDYTDPQTMGAITAYVRSLSNGQRITVRVPAAAEAHFENGRRMYFSRLGQRNFACASCHVVGAGKRYEDVPLSPAIGQAARWPFIRGEESVTLQAQVRTCLERMGVAPFSAGSEELNDLEYFLTYLSNGLPIRANAWRPAAR
ncbi:MAG TPA: sulfur oxidation c-type cytochrome SoxA [Usitatibacter sp.]|nr:sulfur oxidation c-type cytochrome SoxA [Usitatibacter sp.]